MSDGFHWNGEDVAWQGVFDAAPEIDVPFGVHIFIFKTLEAFRAACDEPGAYAWSRTYNEVDNNGIGALILFGPDVPLSNVAHEATHVSLFWARNTTHPNQRSLRWLDEHPESVAEMVGGLTAMLWHSLPKKYRA